MFDVQNNQAYARKSNEWGVDTPLPASPYYEQGSLFQFDAKGKTLAMFDLPSAGLDTNAALQARVAKMGVTKFHYEFETYLVTNLKAYYKVTWSCDWTLDTTTGKWTLAFGKPTGESLAGLDVNAKNFKQVATGPMGSSWVLTR